MRHQLLLLMVAAAFGAFAESSSARPSVEPGAATAVPLPATLPALPAKGAMNGDLAVGSGLPGPSVGDLVTSVRGGVPRSLFNHLGCYNVGLEAPDWPIYSPGFACDYSHGEFEYGGYSWYVWYWTKFSGASPYPFIGYDAMFWYWEDGWQYYGCFDYFASGNYRGMFCSADRLF